MVCTKKLTRISKVSSKYLIHCYDICQFVVEEDMQKMKLNETKNQKWVRQISWQQVKYARRYPELAKDLKKGKKKL